MSTNFHSFSPNANSYDEEDLLYKKDNISDLISIASPCNGDIVYVRNYITGEYGGGIFVYDAEMEKALHNGGTIIDPNMSFPVDWNNQAQLAVWFSSGVGVGCWVRPSLNLDRVDTEEFGAVIGQDNTLVIQTAIDFGIARAISDNKGFVLVLPPGESIISDELDFSLMPGYGAASVGYAIFGSSRASTSLKPTPFGATKAVLRCDHGGHATRVVNSPELRDFRIVGNESPEDPIGIYAPYVAPVFNWENIDIKELGNIAILCYEIDNGDWKNVDVQGCGYQPLEKNLGEIIYCNAVSGSSTLDAVDSSGSPVPGTFTGMAGYTVHVANSGPDNREAFYTVDTPNGDGSSTTVLETFDNTVANDLLSFNPLLGSITAGSNSLTVSADVLLVTDVGRWIFVKGAGTNRTMLMTKILSITGAVVVLEDSAEVTVLDEHVIFTPSICIARPSSLRDDIYGIKTNDHVMTGMRAEKFKGIGMYYEFCANLFYSGKIHGRTSNVEDYANSIAYAFIDNSTEGTWFTNECHYTSCIPGRITPFWVAGEDVNMSIAGDVAYFPETAPGLITWDVTGENSNLYYGIKTNRNRSTKWPISMGDDTYRSDILWDSATKNDYDHQNDDSLFTSQSGFLPAASFYTHGPWSIDDQAKVTVNVVIRSGIMIFTGGAQSDASMIHFRTSARLEDGELYHATVYAGGVVVVAGEYAGTSAEFDPTVDGEDGKINILVCTDGKLVIANRKGGRILCSFTLLGAPT
jgi:hypothetical protein